MGLTVVGVVGEPVLVGQGLDCSVSQMEEGTEEYSGQLDSILVGTAAMPLKTAQNKCMLN